jgi:pimeloyl-ACP methyl ester carboxylesterase
MAVHGRHVSVTAVTLTRVVTEMDVECADGRILHAYDTGMDGLPVFWHHGTPNTGEPPEPLFGAAALRGIRWVSYDRPAYGGSSPQPGRNVASAAADTASVAGALRLGRFAVMGHSGGAVHALACAALLPDRVLAAVCGSGLAPFGARELDWFAGMASAGEAELRAATRGRTALEQHLMASEFDPEQFTPADHAAISGDWAWLAGVAGKAINQGWDGMVDDDLAYVAPWGFDPEQVRPPVLFLHGGQDRIVPSAHSEWLASRCRIAELWRRCEDGHVSVLSAAPAALDWLVAHAR